VHVPFGLRVGMLAMSYAGCAGHPPGESADSAVSAAPMAESKTMTPMAPESLRVRLEVAREIRVGQPVPIVLRLENTGERPLDLYLRGRTIAFDIFITRPAGRIVWQRLKDEIIPAIVQLKVLRPGEVLELKDEWPQRDNRGEPVAPGSYVVRGTVLTEGPAALETPPASLLIAPN
jgi:hypothetical protein